MNLPVHVQRFMYCSIECCLHAQMTLKGSSSNSFPPLLPSQFSAFLRMTCQWQCWTKTHRQSACAALADKSYARKHEKLENACQPYKGRTPSACNSKACAPYRGDLIRILVKLLRRKSRLDHIIIETTGLADPGPVIQTFFTGVAYTFALPTSHHLSNPSIAH